jgi:DHA2 family multidrug resistance protein
VALDRGNRLDWFESTTITTLVTVGVAASVAFVLRALTSPHPIVDLRILSDRTFAVGTTLMAMMGFGLYSSMVLLTFYLEHLLHYDAMTAGWVLSPGGLGSVISLALAGRLVNRVDPRWLVSIGAAIIAYSLHLMASLSLGADFWTVLATRFIQGLGMGLVFVPLTTASLSRVPAASMANATGLYNVVRNVGASAGVAILTTMLARQTQAHQAMLVERVTVWDPATAERLGLLERAYAAAGADPHTASQQALQRLYEEVQRHAAMKAFVDDFGLLMWLFVAFVPAVWLMTRPVHHGPADEPIAVVEAA